MNRVLFRDAANEADNEAERLTEKLQIMRDSERNRRMVVERRAKLWHVANLLRFLIKE